MRLSSICSEKPRCSLCEAAGAVKDWLGRIPSSQPDRSSFRRDSVCTVLAQACLFLSLFLQQPLVPSCGSCLQRRGTNFLFFNQVSSGLHAQLSPLLQCLQDNMFDLSGTGLSPPTQTSLQSGNYMSTPEKFRCFKILKPIRNIRAGSSLRALLLKMQAMDQQYQHHVRDLQECRLLGPIFDLQESESLQMGPRNLCGNKASGRF